MGTETTFAEQAEDALDSKYGHEGRTFEHEGGGIAFTISGFDHGIPGEPDRPYSFGVQLFPDGELEEGESGYFGHKITVDGETFQVNWLW